MPTRRATRIGAVAWFAAASGCAAIIGLEAPEPGTGGSPGSGGMHASSSSSTSTSTSSTGSTCAALGATCATASDCCSKSCTLGRCDANECLNATDQAALQAHACTLVADAVGCLSMNLGNPAGMSTCLQQQDGLSKGCADCSAVEFLCASGAACAPKCANDPFGAVCAACVVTNCGAAFAACSGLTQTDGGLGALTLVDGGDGGASCACLAPGKLFPPVPAGMYCPFGMPSPLYCGSGTHCCEGEGYGVATTCQPSGQACPAGTTVDWQCQDPGTDCTDPGRPVCCAPSAAIVFGAPGCRNYAPSVTQTTCVAQGGCTGGVVMCTKDSECATGESCVAFSTHGISVGACSLCPYGLTACNAACVDVTVDDSNCGSCGHVCMGPTHCSAKSCM